MKSCIIVFPLYKPPSKIELAFLENGVRLTKNFKQVIVAPEGLEISEAFGALQKLEVKRFAQYYFENINGYNQLLLSKEFYFTFRLFDYLLIHQADVYLFKNELMLWCEKNYDYIGSPWFRPEKINQNALFRFLEKLKISLKYNKTYAKRHNKVGNGGLSLRKISAAIKILENVDENLLKKYTTSKNETYNEDIFWSLEAPKISIFNIPLWQEAIGFSVEFNPENAYNYLNGNLPFGCHAPLKHNPKFWKQFIPEIE